MTGRVPHYLIAAPLDRRARRRRRVLRAIGRGLAFPFLVLLALLRWLASPCFL